MTEVIWSPGLSLESVERMVILKAYAFFKHNKSATASSLGIAIRTLDNKLERYDQELKNERDKLAREQGDREQFLLRQRGNVADNVGVRALPRDMMLPPHLRDSARQLYVNESKPEPIPEAASQIEEAPVSSGPKTSPTTYGGGKKK